MSFEAVLENLPLGWAFSHLMALEPSGYQCNLVNYGERLVVFATGDSPALALAFAIQNTYDAKHFHSMYVPGDHASPESPRGEDISTILRRKFGPEPIERRI